MKLDTSQSSPAESYKLLTNLIVPRPLAWITTQNADGLVNLAPFSFFTAVANKPLYLMVSIGQYEDGRPKDTARNILDNGEFVVNLVTEDVFDAMNISGADFPPDVSELSMAGVQTAPSVKIAVPRVAQAHASLECKLFSHQALGNYTLVIGEVLMFHIDDALVGPNNRIQGFTPVARMGSPSTYCRTTDCFDIPRVTYAQLKS
ncbi:MAG: flavin reductase family protein [Candidatus Accumulibacter sp.]|jgi:flavin reductase (DIM6/NTAB) family NADH-FMN oxidoreductase RutF|nr:flavin reductase family protein [Accumulibacter sp.]